MEKEEGGEVIPSLRELSLREDITEQFNVWAVLPMVKNRHFHESLSRREVLVSELQFSIVRKEFFYQKELTQLLTILRQSIFWNMDSPPKYVRRQAAFIVKRLKRMSEQVLLDLEKNYLTEDSIVLNLHRLFDLIYKAISPDLALALLAYSDILSELRIMINKHRNDSKENMDSMRVSMESPVEKVLVPFQRLAQLKSTLVKICDDLRDQRQLAKAHRALDNAAAVLDQCYEYLTHLHGSCYVEDIDNILDMSWKPSSLKYTRHRADYLILPRQHCTLAGGKPPLPAKNVSMIGEEDSKEASEIDALYELVEVPLHWCMTSPAADLLHKSFPFTPLYQTLASCQNQIYTDGESDEQSNSRSDVENGNKYLRTLWCQIEPVVSSGLLDKLTWEEMSLMEAKFEIISSEVSYFKSLSVLITVFYQSSQLRRFISQQDLQSLFSNIAQVKDGSEKFLDDVAYSLSRDVLMSDLCSLVRVHAVTTFRIYVLYCAQQLAMHTTFQTLVSGKEEVVELIGELETSSSCQGYSLISFLTLPLQRVTRLPLLVQAIINRLPDQTSLEHHEATEALKALTQLVNECNEAVSMSDESCSRSGKAKDKSNESKKKRVTICIKQEDESNS